jgi:hypothetical protein
VAYQWPGPDAQHRAGALEGFMMFRVGDRVEKKKGYRWPGEVRSVFTNKAGVTRVVVECTVKAVAGALHIYAPEQLQRRKAKHGKARSAGR